MEARNDRWQMLESRQDALGTMTPLVQCLIPISLTLGLSGFLQYHIKDLAPADRMLCNVIPFLRHKHDVDPSMVFPSPWKVLNSLIGDN